MKGTSAVATMTGATASPHADRKNAPILYVAIRRANGPEIVSSVEGGEYRRRLDNTLHRGLDCRLLLLEVLYD